MGSDHHAVVDAAATDRQWVDPTTVVDFIYHLFETVAGVCAATVYQRGPVMNSLQPRPPQNFLRIAGALDLDIGGVDLDQIVSGQSDRQRAEILFEAF
jgi:hypothetical protein